MTKITSKTHPHVVVAQVADGTWMKVYPRERPDVINTFDRRAIHHSILDNSELTELAQAFNDDSYPATLRNQIQKALG